MRYDMREMTAAESETQGPVSRNLSMPISVEAINLHQLSRSDCPLNRERGATHAFWPFITFFFLTSLHAFLLACIVDADMIVILPICWYLVV